MARLSCCCSYCGVLFLIWEAHHWKAASLCIRRRRHPQLAAFHLGVTVSYGQVINQASSFDRRGVQRSGLFACSLASERGQPIVSRVRLDWSPGGRPTAVPMTSWARTMAPYPAEPASPLVKGGKPSVSTVRRATSKCPTMIFGLLARHLIYIQPGVVMLNQSVQSCSVAPTTVTGSFCVGNYLSDTESGFNPTTGIDRTPPNYMGQSWTIENSRGTGLLDLNNATRTSSLVTRLVTASASLLHACSPSYNIAAAMASPICEVLTLRSLVTPELKISAVRYPADITFPTAASMALAASSNPKL